MNEPDPVIAQETVELVPEGSKRTGLDLDQLVAADDVDHEAIEGDLEAVTGLSEEILDRGVQRALVERPEAVGGLALFGHSVDWREVIAVANTLVWASPGGERASSRPRVATAQGSTR